MTEWTRSNGGPLVCGPAGTARLWMGIGGSSIGRTFSDYDRACATGDLLASIACGSGHVLVLGDQPLSSGFVRQLDGKVVLARWRRCESNEMADAVLKRVPASLRAVERPVELTVDGEPLIMFDAAWDGGRAKKPATIDIDAGTYTVTSEKFELHGAFDFLVHRFLRQP